MAMHRVSRFKVRVAAAAAEEIIHAGGAGAVPSDASTAEGSGLADALDRWRIRSELKVTVEAGNA